MSKIHVLSTGRNAGEFVLKCVESVREQTVKPDSHIVIDDISDDNTRNLLMKYYHNPNYPYLQIIFSTQRKYRLLNLYEHIVDKDPEDIVCIVDSDDWLAHSRVLETIKDVYEKDPKLEYVYSRYKLSSGPMGCSEPISGDWNPYTSRWITSHMCTLKPKALQGIPKANFLDWNGDWFKIATDHAMTLPMIHRLREKYGDYSAIGFINEPLYIHKFYGNPSKPRKGTPEADARAALAVRCSTYIKNRGYIGE